MANNAQFVTQPLVFQASFSTANTARDGTGAITTLITGPATAAGSGVGYAVTGLNVTATGTTTAGNIKFFLSTDSGSTWRIIYEMSVSAATPSATVLPAMLSVPALELQKWTLPGGGTHRIGIATHNAEGFTATAWVGSFA